MRVNYKKICRKSVTNKIKKKPAVSKVSDWDDDASHSLDSGKP